MIEDTHGRAASTARPFLEAAMHRLIEVRGLKGRDIDAFLEEVAEAIEEMELTYTAEAETRARVNAEIDAELKALAAMPCQQRPRPSVKQQPTLF